MENIKNIEQENKLSPIMYSIINNLEKTIWSDKFTINKDNLIFNEIENYESALENIDNLLDDITKEYEITEINFLWNNSLIIKIEDEYLKLFCDVSIMDIVKNKINKIFS